MVFRVLNGFADFRVGIVITDLDQAAEEAEEEYKSEAEPHPDASEYADCNADFTISSVLLEHIKRRKHPANIGSAPDTFVLAPKPPQQEGALILYQPLPDFGALSDSYRPSLTKEEGSAENGLGVDLLPSSKHVVEDDAMDIDS